jgi:hypothetical protein
MSNLTQRLEYLSTLIRNNSAKLNHYEEYEKILLSGGIKRNYIFSFLNKAGFNTWNDFIEARNRKIHDKEKEANIVGGIIGIGLGLLLLGALNDND